MTEIFKSYIDASTAFRKLETPMEQVTDASTGQLYDLLYQLEPKNRNAEENLILCNVYSLLEYHLSAYELFKTMANPENLKDKSKLYTMEQKAKSHKNTFAIKDIRTLKKKQKNKQYSFQLSDFVFSEEIGEEKYYDLVQEEVIIFSQVLHRTDFRVFVHKDYALEKEFNRLLAYLNWLADAKETLIAYYNKEFSSYLEMEANQDWYDTLEVYSAEVGIMKGGRCFANIGAGDNYISDHILDIEFSEDESGNPIVEEMGFNG